MKLPSLDPAEVVKCEKLIEILKTEIYEAGGYIPFARFMEIALYTPHLGYYMSSNPIFGAKGDYVTAPHISPFFAECMAKQFKDILDEMPGGDIIEIGAGTGVFAKDVLLALEKMDCLPAHYYIYEISPILRDAQKKLFTTHCPQLLERIYWLDSLDREIEGIIFGNEVFDALPVHAFRVENAKVRERVVTFAKGQLQDLYVDPVSENLEEKVLSYMDTDILAEGYESEIHLCLPALMQKLEQILQKGVMLFLDYGYGRKEYYHPHRSMGTLMCFLKHYRHANPLLYPGAQDITAHVDFTSVIENSSCDLLGFTTQAGFLLGLDLPAMMAQKNISWEENAGIKQLILPSEMGELMKVIGLGKNFTKKLLGFSFQDRKFDL
jgi:SAM-dependent MidA family methyltransferase